MMIQLQHCGNMSGWFILVFFDELFYKLFRNTVPQITQTPLAKATQFHSLSLVISATVASTTARGEHLRKYFMLINVRQLL